MSEKFNYYHMQEKLAYILYISRLTKLNKLFTKRILSCKDNLFIAKNERTKMQRSVGTAFLVFINDRLFLRNANNYLAIFSINSLFLWNIYSNNRFLSYYLQFFFILLLGCLSANDGQAQHITETKLQDFLYPRYGIIELENTEKTYLAVLNHSQEELNNTLGWYEKIDSQLVTVEGRVRYTERIVAQNSPYTKAYTLTNLATNETQTRNIKWSKSPLLDTIFSIKTTKQINTYRQKKKVWFYVFDYTLMAANPVYGFIETIDSTGKLTRKTIEKKNREMLKMLEKDDSFFECIHQQPIFIDTTLTAWIKVKPYTGCCFGGEEDCQMWVLAWMKIKATDTLKTFRRKALEDILAQSETTANKAKISTQINENNLVVTSQKWIKSFQLINLDGVTVMSNNYDNANRIELNIQNLANGAYILKIKTADEVLLSKIVKNSI